MQDPNPLCDQCQGIFSRKSDNDPEIMAATASGDYYADKHILMTPRTLEPKLMRSDSCQLCVTLKELLRLEANLPADAIIEYWLEIRLGYFMTVRDIIFHLREGGESRRLARFGLHRVDIHEASKATYR